MIYIQRLKEPKKTSGQKLDIGKAILFHGMKIKNESKAPVYLNFYTRQRDKAKAKKSRTK